LSGSAALAIFRGPSAGMSLRRKVLALLPPFLWAGTVWMIGGLQTIPLSSAVTRYDKVAHFVMYGVLGFLCGRSARSIGGRWPAVLLIAGALALGATDEWRQIALTSRSAELADWYADAVGVVTGFLIAARGARQQQRT
jgi:VanZ family protein